MLSLGDRVVSGAAVSCGHCEWCRAGRITSARVPDPRAAAERRSRRVREDAGGHLPPVPDGCTDDAAAMAQPFAVALHALRRTGSPGPSVCRDRGRRHRLVHPRRRRRRRAFAADRRRHRRPAAADARASGETVIDARSAGCRRAVTGRPTATEHTSSSRRPGHPAAPRDGDRGNAARRPRAHRRSAVGADARSTSSRSPTREVEITNGSLHTSATSTYRSRSRSSPRGNLASDRARPRDPAGPSRRPRNPPARRAHGPRQDHRRSTGRMNRGSRALQRRATAWTAATYDWVSGRSPRSRTPAAPWW